MPDRVGSIRRSKVVSTYGPGAIIDFRAPGCGAPLSGVLSSLEWWDDVAPQGFKGTAHSQVLNEPRLQKRLHVQCFRLPPVKPDHERWGKDDKPESNADVLPVIRFPEWLQCPQCDRIKPTKDWQCQKGRPERWCGACSDGQDRVHAVPVRFITACEDGHLDEFPWKAWIGCRCDREKLYLETVGPGLAGKQVVCRNPACVGTPRSLDGCFGKEALHHRGMFCRAREPWIIRDDERDPAATSCPKHPRVLQRGASNVYYGVSCSALDIPPFSADLSHEFGRFWPNLEDKAPEKWPALIDLLDLDKVTGKPKDVLLKMLQDWKMALDADDPTHQIEWAEYVQFQQAGDAPVDKGEFRTAPVKPPSELLPYVASIVQASRLREVRAQIGFTRIHPLGGSFGAAGPQMGKIYHRKPAWLPAIALLGEGIFLRLDLERLQTWESRADVKARAEKFLEEVTTRLRPPGDARPVPLELAARFVLLHSLAHALMRRLSLDCGYGSSALRERLFVGDAPRDMAGVLIHTGAPDSEGTLGGLVRQGLPDRIWETFRGALEEMSWCSSDPVCITGTATLSSPHNGAACHACLLVPETSCQHFNVLLDRAMLIGLPETPDLGFFRPLLVDVLQ
jgi:hypothetical protein